MRVPYPNRRAGAISQARQRTSHLVEAPESRARELPRMSVAKYKRRLRDSYMRWLRVDDSLSASMDCGYTMRRHVSGQHYLKPEQDCQKWATKLRKLGENVPPVPGEDGFK